MNKVELHSYSDEFVSMYEGERKRLQDAIPDVDINHVGSTAVPGVGGKGIIDVLIGIENWSDKGKVVEALDELGFHHIHPEENGRIFLSRVGPTSYGDTHLHLVKKDGEQYKELLLFRDYLRGNKDEAANYDKLKRHWLEKAGGDRERYRKLKFDYVRNIVELAKRS